MNAFLLITSAALAGADPAPAVKPGPVVGAPVAGAPVAGAPAYGAPAYGAPITSTAPWGGTGGSCCGGGGGAVAGGDCGCGSSCDSCCESGGFFSKMKGRFGKHKGCGCDSGCDSGCDGGCSSCGGGYGGAAYGGATYGAPGTIINAPGQMAPAGEPIKAPNDANPPKKLPSGGRTSIDSVPEVTPLPPATTQGVGTNNNANPF